MEYTFVQNNFKLTDVEELGCSYSSTKQCSLTAFCFTYCSDILHVDKQNADAVYVRGMCLYYQDNVEQALCHFQHVLRLAPDHQKAVDIYKACFSISMHAECCCLL
jgi:tetratricopeptide (TPR) repeat protein